jgi:hypothetical protein
MSRVKSFFLPALVVGAMALSPYAEAGGSACKMRDCFTGLVTVNIVVTDVNVWVNDVDVNHLVVVDVHDILNESDISILEDLINNNTIASQNRDFLNNLLQRADISILTDNETVVGVLKGGIIVVDVLSR